MGLRRPPLRFVQDGRQVSSLGVLGVLGGQPKGPARASSLGTGPPPQDLVSWEARDGGFAVRDSIDALVVAVPRGRPALGQPVTEGAGAGPQARQLRVTRREGRQVPEGALCPPRPLLAELVLGPPQERAQPSSTRSLLTPQLTLSLSESPLFALLSGLASPYSPPSLGLGPPPSSLLLEPVRGDAVGEPAKSLEDLREADLGLAVASGSKELLSLLEDPLDVDALVIDPSVNSVLEGLRHARDLSLAVSEDEVGPELGLEDLAIVGVGLVRLVEALARLPVLELCEVSLTRLKVMLRQGRALLVSQRELSREARQAVVFW